MHKQFIEPTKRNADVILPHGANGPGRDIITAKVKSLLLTLCPAEPLSRNLLTGCPPSPTTPLPSPKASSRATWGHGFIEIVGPLYYRRAPGSERLRGISLASGVEQRHCNPAAPATAACWPPSSTCCCRSPRPAPSRSQAACTCPTISLQLDYLAGALKRAALGGVTARCAPRRNMVFVQAVVSADGTPVARASGIFKIGPALGQYVSGG